MTSILGMLRMIFDNTNLNRVQKKQQHQKC